VTRRSELGREFIFAVSLWGRPGSSDLVRTSVSPSFNRRVCCFAGMAPTRACRICADLPFDAGFLTSISFPGRHRPCARHWPSDSFPQLPRWSLNETPPRVAEMQSIPQSQARQPGLGHRHDGSACEGGTSGWESDVSQIRAGATTRPQASRCGRYFKTAGPGSIDPVRSLGPQVHRNLQRFFVSFSARRRFRIIPDQASGLSWAQLIRMQSMPWREGREPVRTLSRLPVAW